MAHESLHKEIDLIQACITRMAHNSFLLKGWAVTLCGVVLALADKQLSFWHACFMAIAPLVCFWYLDAFFLRTEKQYRDMYNWVIKARLEGDTSYLYDLNPHRFKKGGILSIMFSKTLWGLYLVLILLILGAGWFSREETRKEQLTSIANQAAPNP